MNPPEPETLVAILPSAGFGYSRATKHSYLEAREIVLPQDGPSWEYIYICAETGAERRWGFAPRKIPSWLRDGAVN